MAICKRCAVLVVLALAACSTDGNIHQGRVVAAATRGDDPTRERWIVTVDLDSGVVGGSNVVQVAFDASELACADATRVSPEELSVGSQLSFIRVGDGYDAMSPPVIAARTLTASC